MILVFYHRFWQAGKAKEPTLTVCMRKLLTILNAMLKSSAPCRLTDRATTMFKPVVGQISTIFVCKTRPQLSNQSPPRRSLLLVQGLKSSNDPIDF